MLINFVTVCLNSPDNKYLYMVLITFIYLFFRIYKMRPHLIIIKNYFTVLKTR